MDIPLVYRCKNIPGENITTEDGSKVKSNQLNIPVENILVKLSGEEDNPDAAHQIVICPLCNLVEVTPIQGTRNQMAIHIQMLTSAGVRVEQVHFTEIFEEPTTEDVNYSTTINDDDIALFNRGLGYIEDLVRSEITGD